MQYEKLKAVFFNDTNPVQACSEQEGNTMQDNIIHSDLAVETSVSLGNCCHTQIQLSVDVSRILARQATSVSSVQLDYLNTQLWLELI